MKVETAVGKISVCNCAVCHAIRAVLGCREKEVPVLSRISDQQVFMVSFTGINYSLIRNILKLDVLEVEGGTVCLGYIMSSGFLLESC